MVIELKQLSKHFKILNRREGLIGTVKDLISTDYTIVKAVDCVSCQIQAGEVVGYLGSNGAGKSTTIKMMTGILKPTSGEIFVLGKVPFEKRKENVRNIGVLFGQRTQLWWDLPVIESFKILKEIYQIDDNAYAQQMDLFNQLVDLKRLYARPVRHLSLGQRMLCDLLAIFLHNPKIVFLDEPTIGLDINVKSKIRTLIKELNETQNTSIILTTHDMGDIEALCQRIIILDKGKIIYDDTTQKITTLFGLYRTLKVELLPGDAAIKQQLRSELMERFHPPKIENGHENWIYITINQEKIPLLDILNFILTGFPVKDIQTVEITTEEVVRNIYDGQLG